MLLLNFGLIFGLLQYWYNFCIIGKTSNILYKDFYNKNLQIKPWKVIYKALSLVLVLFELEFKFLSKLS